MKKLNRLGSAVAVMALALGCAAALQQADAEKQLEAAIHREVVQGDLKGAMERYRKIRAQFPAQRAVAARALFQLGACQEKLGQVEARKAYERLIKEYGDQEEVVGKARARLAALGASRPAAAGVIIRDLKVDLEGRQAWNLSADGRYFGVTDSATGNGSIFDVATSKVWNVTDYGTWNNEKGYIDVAAISRDGKFLAMWHNFYGGTNGSLRIAAADGKQERIVYRARKMENGVEWGIPRDWSPDGKYVAVQLERGAGTSGAVTDFALVPTEGGEPRVVKTAVIKRRYRPKILFSPDGKYLAFDYPSDPDQKMNGDIFVVPAAGGTEVAIAPHSAQDTLIGWAPDGSLLFASDRSGSRALYRVKMQDGQQQGEPEMIRALPQFIFPIGVTRDGAFYYGEVSRVQNAYEVLLDVETGKTMSQPRRLSATFQDTIRFGTWSPDGKRVAYLHDRGGSERSILVRNVDDVVEREVVPSVRLEICALRLRWSASGDAFHVWAKAGTESGLYRIDEQTGQVSLLTAGSCLRVGEPPFIYEWSADGRFVYFEKSDRRFLYRKDRQTGEEKQLYERKRNLLGFRLSPDGKWLALFDRMTADGAMHILAVSTETGEIRNLFQWDPNEEAIRFGAQPVAWAKDGKMLLFLRQKRSSDQLWIVPFEGGPARQIEFNQPDSIDGLDLHPDGKRLAYTSTKRKTDFWVIENFLPKTVASH